MNDIVFEDVNEIAKTKRKSKWKDYLGDPMKSDMTGIIFPSQYSRNGQLKKGQKLQFKQDNLSNGSKSKSSEIFLNEEIDKEN